MARLRKRYSNCRRPHFCSSRAVPARAMRQRDDDPCQIPWRFSGPRDGRVRPSARPPWSARRRHHASPLGARPAAYGPMTRCPEIEMLYNQVFVPFMVGIPRPLLRRFGWHLVVSAIT
jgi:hypothetical protein